MTNDVEKRWHDPATFHAAVTFVVAFVAVAGIALAAYAFGGGLLAASLVPTILFVGGVVAFVNTYRLWRAEGTWPIWHGAGWFLFSLSLVCLSVPGTAMMAT